MSFSPLFLAALALAATPARAYYSSYESAYSLSVGAIVAIVVINVVFWGGLIGGLVWCMRRRQRAREAAMGPVPLYDQPPPLYQPVSADSEGKLPPPPAGYEYQLSYGAPAPGQGGQQNQTQPAYAPAYGQQANYSHA